MKLSDYLKKENNNLDLIRIIAAIMVIIGHSYALAPAHGHIDPVASLFTVIYSGSMAVSIFFFISGLVVTNSLMKKKSMSDFIISRVFRIFPALFVVLVMTALVMGPLVSTYNYYDYFQNSLTFQYVYDNLRMIVNFSLPGVFEQNHRPSGVNGSLWTLVWEVKFYLFLLAFFLMGSMKNRYIASSIAGLLVLSPIYYPLFSATNHEIYYLPMMFSLGVLFAINKEYIYIDYRNLIGILLLVYLVKDLDEELYSFVLHISLAISVIYFSSLKIVKKLKLNSDISYGIYIYAWPIQQILNLYFPEQNSFFNMIVATIFTMPLAYLSWTLVEKKSIAIGKNLQRTVIASKIQQRD